MSIFWRSGPSKVRHSLKGDLEVFLCTKTIFWAKRSILANRTSYTPLSDTLFFDSIWYRYDIWLFYSIWYDINTIFWPQKRPSFWGIFSEFSEISANFLNFRRISGEFSEFPENFRIFRRIFGGKRQNKGISRAYRDTRYGRFDTIYSSIYEKVRYIGIR